MTAGVLAFLLTAPGRRVDTAVIGTRGSAKQHGVYDDDAQRGLAKGVAWATADHALYELAPGTGGGCQTSVNGSPAGTLT